MQVIHFSADRMEPISLYDSVSAFGVPLGHGRGEAHVYCVHMDAGGRIGAHRAGFSQLFLVVAGSGWACGEDGRRADLAAGRGVYFARGETHAKGSDTGMTALMVQVDDLAPAADALS